MVNTNLYTSVTELFDNRANESRKLEEYLLAIWFLASQYKHQTAITIKQFIELLELAFIAEVPAFRDKWRSLTFNLYADEENSYLAFEETIIEQIVDLREMDETGLLSNELRYFGIDSPRGNRWFNFDPTSYLECAAACLDAYYTQTLEDDTGCCFRKR